MPTQVNSGTPTPPPHKVDAQQVRRQQTLTLVAIAAIGAVGIAAGLYLTLATPLLIPGITMASGSGVMALALSVGVMVHHHRKIGGPREVEKNFTLSTTRFSPLSSSSRQKKNLKTPSKNDKQKAVAEVVTTQEEVNGWIQRKEKSQLATLAVSWKMVVNYLQDSAENFDPPFIVAIFNKLSEDKQTGFITYLGSSEKFKAIIGPLLSVKEIEISAATLKKIIEFPAILETIETIPASMAFRMLALMDKKEWKKFWDKNSNVSRPDEKILTDVIVARMDKVSTDNKPPEPLDRFFIKKLNILTSKRRRENIFKKVPGLKEKWQELKGKVKKKK